MMPSAKSSRSSEERLKIRRTVDRRGLVGLANDTKWDELLAVMRSHNGWVPSFRWKCVDGPPMDRSVAWYHRDWHHRLPFPLMSVEWMDLARREETRIGFLVPPLLTDHTPWIEEVLRDIGFEYEVGSKAIRVFGYAPKSLELFEL